MQTWQELLQPGDVLIRDFDPIKGEAGVAARLADRVQEFGMPVTQGNMQHAVMYVGDGQVIGATAAAGVRRTPIATALGNQPFAAFRPIDAVDARRAVEYASQQLGQPYGTRRLVATGLAAVTPAQVHPLLEALAGCSGPVCSTLVTDAYEQAGVKLTGVPSGLASPSDLAFSDRMRQVLGTTTPQKSAIGRKSVAGAAAAAATLLARRGAGRVSKGLRQAAKSVGLLKGSGVDLLPGDVILREPKPRPSNRSFGKAMGETIYRKGGPLTQGNLPHAMMYSGGGNVLEVLERGLQQSTLDDALGSTRYAVFRPDVVDVDQLLDALRAKAGTPYGGRRMVATGLSQLTPAGLTGLLDAACDGPVCTTAITEALDEVGISVSPVNAGVAGSADIAFGGKLRHVGGTVTPQRPTFGRFARSPGPTRALYATMAAVPVGAGLLARHIKKSSDPSTNYPPTNPIPALAVGRHFNRPPAGVQSGGVY